MNFLECTNKLLVCPIYNIFIKITKDYLLWKIVKLKRIDFKVSS